MENKELIEDLRMCCSSRMTDCALCPENGAKGGICFERLNKRAADTIEQLEAELAKLREENRRLRDANEKTAEGLARRLADMAREGNTALERGLEGVNIAKLAEMTGIQSKLEALGRGSVIRAEPAGRMDGSMRIQEVVVEGRVVFRADAQEIATSPAAPRNDMETGGPDG